MLRTWESRTSASELGRVGPRRTLQRCEHLRLARQRLPCVVHEEELLLGADPAYATLDRPRIDHALKGLEVLEHRLHERAEAASASLADVLDSHVRSIGSGSPRE